MKKLAFAVCLLASPATAHDFHNLEVAGIRSVPGGVYFIDVNDTTTEMEIVCAIYDEDGKLLASTTWFGNNLASAVMITSEVEPASARCVLDE